jgi:uroporphyrinogen III methyltransferase / synthase
MRPGQPLEGRTIVVTRAAAQARSFVDLLRADGARVIKAPSIAIEPPTSWELLDATLNDLGRYTWVVFTSVNGVAMVDRRLRERGQSWRALAAKQIAAIGPATAEALAEHGARSALPDEFRGARGRPALAQEGAHDATRDVPSPTIAGERVAAAHGARDDRRSGLLPVRRARARHGVREPIDWIPGVFPSPSTSS